MFNLDDRVPSMLTRGSTVIDIGGGLRVSEGNNKGVRNVKYRHLIEERGVNYLILDKVADYDPDIVGDVHNLPLENESVDGVICVSLLEHVENPWQAMEEIYRVLKPGGYLYFYVPFLYYYHAMPGYYKDFYRFTEDGVRYLLRNFSEVEIQNRRGALASVMMLFPFVTKRPYLDRFFEWIDRLTGKDKSKQASGYAAFCRK